MDGDFQFKEPPSTATFVCQHVSDDQEGDWQVLCGGTHSEEPPRAP